MSLDTKGSLYFTFILSAGFALYSSSHPIIASAAQNNLDDQSHKFTPTDVPPIATDIPEVRATSTPSPEISIPTSIMFGDKLYNIVDQPKNDLGYISNDENALTNFRLATSKGNIGLIAHNYKAGADFYNLKGNDVIRANFGKESTDFVVTEILRYDVVKGKNRYESTKYRDQLTGEILSTDELIEKIYGGSYHLTLQTCIGTEGSKNDGRLFVIAEPTVTTSSLESPDNGY